MNVGVHISLDVHILKTQEIVYMDDSKKIQTRREFFKKAAKRALLILGAIIVSGIPSVTLANEKVQQDVETTVEQYARLLVAEAAIVHVKTIALEHAKVAKEIAMAIV